MKKDKKNKKKGKKTAEEIKKEEELEAFWLSEKTEMSHFL